MRGGAGRDRARWAGRAGPLPGRRRARMLCWAGIATLLALLLSLPAYSPWLSTSLALLAVALLAGAARRPLPVAGLALLLGGGLLWAAFATTTGYFWLNRHRLEALLAEIEAVPAIASLELGQEAEWVTPEGERRRYDSYRFINGQAVTQHRRQVAPGAAQPVLFEADLLRELGVAPPRYQTLRAALRRLSLAGFDRG